MGGMFSKPKVETPPLPPPEPPIAMPEKGAGEVTKRRKMIKAGRGGTILAGQMTPQKIGKTPILGGSPLFRFMADSLKRKHGGLG